MIDTAIRSQGIGGSEIAAIVGMDPRRDKFAVYAEKLGLVDRAEPNARMVWGKRIEQVIAEAYAGETHQDVRWLDETIAHSTRLWQVMTPDALVWGPTRINDIPRINPIGGLDAKNVAWDQAYAWGESGSDTIPEHISLQCQWYCSAAELPWWDVAALFGGNDLRIYRVHRSADIEAVLLEQAEAFWRDHVLAKNPPPIGSSETAAAYLKKRFPKNVQAVRPATTEEAELLSILKDIRGKYDTIAAKKKAIENEVKLVIADADGLQWGKDKVTFKLCKSTVGTDWEKVARLACDDADRLQALIADSEIVVKQGSRRLSVPRSWKADSDDDE